METFEKYTWKNRKQSLVFNLSSVLYVCKWIFYWGLPEGKYGHKEGWHVLSISKPYLWLNVKNLKTSNYLNQHWIAEWNDCGLICGQRTRLRGCTVSICQHLSHGTLVSMHEEVALRRQKSLKIISPIYICKKELGFRQGWEIALLLF